MAKTCAYTDGCSYPVFSKKLCLIHWKAEYGKPIKVSVPTGPAKPRAEINKKSVKKKDLDAQYKIVRDKFMAEEDNKYCAAQWAACTGRATECHHARGRGIYLLDTSTYRPLCQSCHHEVGIQHERALREGLSENRLDKYEEG